MKIYISTSDYAFSEYPKQLIVYCDGKLKATLDLIKRNVVDIDDNVSRVKIVCQSYSRKNKVSSILFFLIAILSMIFGTNGSEAFDYIFEDTIEFETTKEDIYIKYLSKDIHPFSIEKEMGEIIRNYRNVEKKVFKNWIFVVISPIQIILFTVITIFIISSQYMWFNFLIILLGLGFEIYILIKVKKAHSFIQNRN